MSEIKSRKTIALLTTGLLLMVLSAAMPAAYADIISDPKVSGSGNGHWSDSTCVTVIPSNDAVIQFDARGGIPMAHGGWAITVAGIFTFSGTINQVSAPSQGAFKGFFALSGTQTDRPSMCAGPSGEKISIIGGCGTATLNIFFNDPLLSESFAGSGTVTCKG